MITTDKTEHKLAIKDVALADAGDYTFKASDTEESTVTLTVSGELKRNGVELVLTVTVFCFTKLCSCSAYSGHYSYFFISFRLFNMKFS